MSTMGRSSENFSKRCGCLNLAGCDVYLGIDLGTGTLKAAVFGDGGAVVAEAEESYATPFTGSGSVDFDAAMWWTVCKRVLRKVTADHGSRIEAVGLAGQMHGVVLIDEAGRPVRNAVLWPDHRAESQLAVFRRFDGEHGGVLGNPIVPGMAGPILAWMARHEPHSLRAAVGVVQPKDWLRMQLCRSAAFTDPSDASATLLYDVVADDWSVDLCREIGIDAAMLPPIGCSDQSVGVLDAEVAGMLGLREIPVVMGAGDAAAALVGAGVERPGTALINTGTGGQVMTPMATSAVAGGVGPGIHQYRTASQAPQWYAMAAVANGGLALGWVRKMVGYDWDRVYSLAGSVLEHGASDPTFLPFLAGEREPGRDDPVGAAWRGLKLAHDPDALVRSALRGVAFYLGLRARALIELTGVSRAVVSGGSTRHPDWVELLATVLGTDVAIAPDMHLTVRGAARLAARGVGHDFPTPVDGSEVSPRRDVDVTELLRDFDDMISRYFATSA